MLTTANTQILGPAQVTELLVRPVMAGSVALQVAKVIQTSGSSLRVPILDSEAAASWTAQGAEIEISDPEFDEMEIHFHSLKGLTPISAEMIADSSPEASALVGESLARDMATRVDAAFFGSAAPAHGPAGIGSVSGVQAVNAGAAYDNLDWAHEAIAKVEEAGAQVSAFVTTPGVALALAMLKTASGSNAHLLGPDPTSPTTRTVAGVPLFVSTAVEADTVWAIPFGRTIVALRKDVRVDVDNSAYFTSDRVAVRAVMRLGMGFPHPGAIAKVTVTP